MKKKHFYKFLKNINVFNEFNKNDVKLNQIIKNKK